MHRSKPGWLAVLESESAMVLAMSESTEQLAEVGAANSEHWFGSALDHEIDFEFDQEFGCFPNGLNWYCLQPNATQR